MIFFLNLLAVLLTNTKLKAVKRSMYIYTQYTYIVISICYFVIIILNNNNNNNKNVTFSTRQT